MNSKSFFLTYPQSNIDKNEFLLFARTKGTLVEYVIGRELHADGTPHLHAALKYTEAIRGTIRLFDFEGRHPNIQSPRAFLACKRYCKKDGDFIENEAVEVDQIEPRSISQVCQETLLEEDWYVYCINEKIGFQYASWFWHRFHMDIVTIHQDDNIEGQISEPLASFLWNIQQYPVLGVIGPTGCGKTSWAKSWAPKPALFVSHIDQLRMFKPGFHKVIIIIFFLYKSIIFDDIDVCHYPRTSQIHLMDFHNTRAIHIRHVIATIPAGTVKVFTANTNFCLIEDPAIARRIKIVRVHANGLAQ